MGVSALAEGETVASGTPLKSVSHTVTHHRITLYPVAVTYSEPRHDLSWFKVGELVSVPLPRPSVKC